MKNIKKYFGLTLIALLFSVVFSACEDKDELGSGNIGLGIKVVAPTKVVSGQPVTINGSGFGQVTEIVFPGNLVVKDFERVSNEMIRVVTPQGINISDEGAKLIVRTPDDEAESPLNMTQGHPMPRNYSAEEGADVKSKEIFKIFGQDMEFVNKVTFTDRDDNPIEIQAKDFYRIATNSVSVKIPSNIKEGLQVGTFETIDGQKFTMPEFNFVATKGHWEISRKVLWKNEDPAGNGAVSWGGTPYRFSSAERSTGEEIYAFPIEDWEIIKTQEFYVDIEATAPTIRILDAWWSGPKYTADDIQAGNELLADNGDGTMTITVNLVGLDLLNTIDEKHLLFAGDAYTPLTIYIQEEIWVEEEEGHWERKSLWKNDGTVGAASWGGTPYRFSSAERSTGEEIHAFPMEDWEIIKTQEFYVDIEATAPTIRILDAWWSGPTYTPADIQVGNELLVDNGDGTMTITVNLAGSDLLSTIDEKHLLFAGDAYTVLEIYVNEWVGDSAKKPTVLWENDGTADYLSWGGTPYRFCSEERSTGEEIHAFPMEDWEIIKTHEFFVDIEATAPTIRILDAWWSGPTYTPADIQVGNELLVDNGDGTMTITVNLVGSDLLSTIDEKHLLFAGDAYKVLKIYYYK